MNTISEINVKKLSKAERENLFRALCKLRRTKTKVMTFTIPEILCDALHELPGRTMSNFVQQALKEKFQREYNLNFSEDIVW